MPGISEIGVIEIRSAKWNEAHTPGVWLKNSGSVTALNWGPGLGSGVQAVRWAFAGWTRASRSRSGLGEEGTRSRVWVSEAEPFPRHTGLPPALPFFHSCLCLHCDFQHPNISPFFHLSPFCGLPFFSDLITHTHKHTPLLKTVQISWVLITNVTPSNLRAPGGRTHSPTPPHLASVPLPHPWSRVKAAFSFGLCPLHWIPASSTFSPLHLFQLFVLEAPPSRDSKFLKGRE